MKTIELMIARLAERLATSKLMKPRFVLGWVKVGGYWNDEAMILRCTDFAGPMDVWKCRAKDRLWRFRDSIMEKHDPNFWDLPF